MKSFDALRRMRLRALLAWQVRNWREVFDAYMAGAQPPPLRFRNGMMLHHECGDSPVFLFFEIFANGCYRRSAPLPQHGTIVDIGANIGAFALDCAFRRPLVTIHAYEPNPRVFRTLEKNVAENGLQDRVRLFDEAVAACDGTLQLWDEGASVAAGAFGSRPAGAASLDVKAVSLTTVTARAGNVNLLKIDAEGAEVEILSRASDLACVARVVGEYHEHLVPGCAAHLKQSLETAGFTFNLVNSGRCESLFVARNRRELHDAGPGQRK